MTPSPHASTPQRKSGGSHFRLLGSQTAKTEVSTTVPLEPGTVAGPVTTGRGTVTLVAVLLEVLLDVPLEVLLEAPAAEARGGASRRAARGMRSERSRCAQPRLPRARLRPAAAAPPTRGARERGAAVAASQGSLSAQGPLGLTRLAPSAHEAMGAIGLTKYILVPPKGMGGGREVTIWLSQGKAPPRGPNGSAQGRRNREAHSARRSPGWLERVGPGADQGPLLGLEGKYFPPAAPGEGSPWWGKAGGASGYARDRKAGRLPDIPGMEGPPGGARFANEAHASQSFFFWASRESQFTFVHSPTPRSSLSNRRPRRTARHRPARSPPSPHRRPCCFQAERARESRRGGGEASRDVVLVPQ